MIRLDCIVYFVELLRLFLLYEAILHKGERVLTAQQNRQYNQGGSNVSIPKLADTIVVREDADITKIANALVKKLNESKLVYGGAY